MLLDSPPGAFASIPAGSTVAVPADAPPAATPDLGPTSTAVPNPQRSSAPTAAPTAAGTAGPVAACPIFPLSNVWNRDISALPVAADSATLIASIGLGANLHPDFSATGDGIPINVVGPSAPRASASFQYANESDTSGLR